MIEINVRINNIPGNVNLDTISQQLAQIVQQATGQKCDTRLNITDDHSISPLGLHGIKEKLHRERLQ